MNFPLAHLELKQRTQALADLRDAVSEGLRQFNDAPGGASGRFDPAIELREEFQDADSCVIILNQLLGDLTKLRNQIDAAGHIAAGALFSTQYEEELRIVEAHQELTGLDPATEDAKSRVGTREGSNASILPHIYKDPTKAKAFKAAKSEFASELAWQANCSEAGAHRIITNSVSLLHMPQLERFYLSGDLPEARLTDVVATTEDLHPEVLELFDRGMMEYLAPTNKPVPKRSRTQIRKRANALREVFHHESLSERRQRDERRRAVFISSELNGLATLTAHLPAESAYAVMNTITDVALASRSAKDPRTLAQVRADVFTDLILNGSAVHTPTETRSKPDSRPGDVPTEDLDTLISPSPRDSDGMATADEAPIRRFVSGKTGVSAAPTESDSENSGPEASAPHSKIPAKIVVTIPYDVLLGLRDGFANLDGYGPIPGDLARDLASNAKNLYRIITDPATDLPLEYQRGVYRVTQEVRDFLLQRTETCEFPGCTVSARRTDADHIDPWDSGGETTPENLQLLCRKHHNLKTHRGWKSSRTPDGGTMWTSPLGNVSYTAPTPSAPPGTKALTELTRPPTQPSEYIRFLHPVRSTRHRKPSASGSSGTRDKPSPNSSQWASSQTGTDPWAYDPSDATSNFDSAPF